MWGTVSLNFVVCPPETMPSTRLTSEAVREEVLDVGEVGVAAGTREDAATAKVLQELTTHRRRRACGMYSLVE